MTPPIRLRAPAGRAIRFACVAAIVAASSGTAVAAPLVDDSPPASAKSLVSPKVSRLVVRFRPGAQPEDGARLAGRQLADLRMALGRDFTVGAPTRTGDQVLVLAEPVSPSEAKSVVKALRMRPDVLRADVEYASRKSPEALARAKSLADAEPVARFIVTFRDPALQQAARGNLKLAVEFEDLLSGIAGVRLRAVRAAAGGSWIVAPDAPVSGPRAREIVAALEAHPAILNAAADRRARAHAAFHPNDPAYQQGYLWNLDDPVSGSYYGVDAAQAWAITTGSPSITVAIVDTGITAHPELVNRTSGGYDFIHDPDDARDGDARDPNPKDWGTYGSASECDGTAEDSSWHGSHVAGIVGASGNNGTGIVGVDWQARLMPIRVLGRCGSGYNSDIDDGMYWAGGGAVPGIPPNPTPARVINMSLGGKGECSASRQALIDETLARGALIVVSAGNENDDADLYEPASCYGVSTVVATDPYGYRASYSNYSVYADISAPGGDSSRYSQTDGVLSTVDSSKDDPSGNYDYDWYNGTSMAAPHVSGVASLMLAVNGSLTPSQIKGIMADTSSYFASDSVCRTQENCGAGIVNAFYAVKEAIRMLSVPKVRVIEYYNSALNHFFIAAESQPDVFALDSGAIPGWSRTGRTFNAYAGAESGLSGVCRFYIPPDKGNSHFYSVSAEECEAIYNAAYDPSHPGHANYAGFVYETGSAFFIDTPVDDTCPPTRVPVWRLWNHRLDTNHRYTTDPAVRAQMIAQGSIDEGIRMCALP